LNEHLKISKP